MSTLKHVDSRFPCRPDPYELDLDPQELLDEADITLAIFRELVEHSTIRNVALPPWKSFILHFDTGESVEVG